MPPPVDMDFIILDIWACCFRRLFTSVTVVPEPLAMRLRRLPLMMLLLARSFLVMELMMASTRSSCLSSTWLAACCMPWKGPTEGSILRMDCMLPSFLIWRSCSRKSSREKPSPEKAFAGEGFGFALVELFFGALEEGGDVAHADDAADDAVGVEGFEGVGFFAGGEELDGGTGDFADRERGAAAGVAVHFGEDGAGDLQAVVEGLGGVDGVLAGHGVGDEEDLGGVEGGFELGHFVHEGFVDAEAAGGVDDEDVVGEVTGFAEGFLGEAEDVGGAGGVVRCRFYVVRGRRVGGEFAFVDPDVDQFGDDFELLAGGGAVDVDGDEQGAVAALFEPGGEFAGGRRLPGALQAGHEDDGGGLGGEFEPGGVMAEDIHELVADDFDDLFGGREGGGDFGAEGFGADVVDDVAGDVEVDVGFEERGADGAEGGVDVVVGEGALAAEVLEGALELVAEVLKHGWVSVYRAGGGGNGGWYP